MTAFSGSATRKNSTPSIAAGTLSLVITCWLGMLSVSSRRSTNRTLSIKGMIYSIPGPRTVWNLPSLSTTPRSHWAATRTPETRIPQRTANTTSGRHRGEHSNLSSRPYRQEQYQTEKNDRNPEQQHPQRRSERNVPSLGLGIDFFCWHCRYPFPLWTHKHPPSRSIPSARRGTESNGTTAIVNIPCEKGDHPLPLITCRPPLPPGVEHK